MTQPSGRTASTLRTVRSARWPVVAAWRLWLAGVLLLAATLLTACSSQPRDAGPALLLSLPMLPDGALALDGGYRVQVHDGDVVRVLILVVRSDDDGFRFEAIDELGLPQLAWPVRADAPPLPGSADPVLPGIVARMIQLSLADPAAWTGVLEGTPWRLDVAADGVRTLVLDGQPRVRIDGVPAGPSRPRALLYCPGGIAPAGACARGRGMAIDVSALDVAAGP